MDSKRPFMITFIGDWCVFGAFLILLSFFPMLTQKAGVIIGPVQPSFNLSPLGENVVKIFYLIVLILTAYGFFKLKKWAYWLIVIPDFCFLAAAVIQLVFKTQHTFFNRDIIGLTIALLFIVPTKKYFDKKTESE